MKSTKLTLIILLCLTSSKLMSQWDTELKTGLHTGYEWNIFLNPPTVIDGDQVLRRADLWQNAFYEEGFISANMKRKTANGRWKLGTYFSAANYHSRVDANRHALRFDLSYRTKYAAKKYFEIAPQLYRIKRQGINDQDAVLTTPFSYMKFTLPVKFDFYLGDRKWLKTTGGYFYKAFDRFNNRNIAYHAVFLEAKYSKKWLNAGNETKLTYTGRSEFRFYKIQRLNGEVVDPEEPIDPEDPDAEANGLSDRRWTYLSNDLEYSIKPAHDKYSLNLGLYTTIRLDGEEENSYFELAPGIEGTMNFTGWQLSGRLQYVNRNYPDREVGDEDMPLVYQYVRGSVKATVPIKKRTDFFVRANMVNRASSNNELTRGFREYFNSVVETGIVIRLK